MDSKRILQSILILCCFCIGCFSALEANSSRALVIILAETRAHELTYENIKYNLLDILDADLAVCIGVKDDYCYDNPFYRHAKYRFLYPEPEDYASAFDYASQIIFQEDPSITQPFDWRQFLKIKDQFLGGIHDPHDQHPGSAGILIFFRWFLLHHLIREDLLDKYDFFIVTRSDYVYTLPHPSLDVFSEDYLYIPNGQHYSGVTDRHAILPKKFVVPYLNILNAMVGNGDEYYEKMKNHSRWNLEQFILFHLKQHGIADAIRFFPYVMYTVRPINGATRWAQGVFSPEHNYYIKYRSEYDQAHGHLNDYRQERPYDPHVPIKSKEEKPFLDVFYRKRLSH